MNEISNSFFSSPSVLLSILSLVATGVAVLIGLNCIWRVERRLKTYMNLITTSVFLLCLRKVTGLMGYGQTVAWNHILLGFDFAIGIFLLLSFWEMYRIIRAANKENRKR